MLLFKTTWSNNMAKGIPYINQLAAQGGFFFTTCDLIQQFAMTTTAANALLRRLKAKHEIATPYPGFHLIIPPEFRVLGCLPAEQFIPALMCYLNIPYYVGLLSAAAFYGITQPALSTLQIIVPDNRNTIHCGNLNIEFIARNNLQNLPIKKFPTSKGTINVATAELTALDLVNSPSQSEGLTKVLRLLKELTPSLSKQALVNLTKLVPYTPPLQRLGFFLEAINQEELAQIVEQELLHRKMKKRLLVSKIKVPSKATVNSRWKIIINKTWGQEL